jgi:hypothetical protein
MSMTDIEVSASSIQGGETSGNPRPATGSLPPRGLTIPARRLAGSPACLNCGTVLAGPFCHYCGQPDKNLLRFFPVLLREMLADFMDFDSRFARTMKPLLFHPGKLTRDYLDGRRFRYTPPLRLYIFASMAFFLIAAMLASSAIQIGDDEEGSGKFLRFGNENIKVQVEEGLDEAVKSGEMTEAERAELLNLAKKGGIIEALDLPADSSDTSAEITPEPEASDSGPSDAESSSELQASDDEDTITINGQPWNRETNPAVIPFMPGFINDWINDEIEESPAKGREIEANPNIIVDKVMDVFPIAVFIMLPLVALILKFWYLFSGHYYIEHLIHALHNHAFLFVVFTLIILADAVAGWKEPDTAGAWTTAAGWIDLALLVWIPLYLLISLKRVYRQGWTLTLFKFSLVGISYIVLLALVTSAAAVAGFVLL